MCGGAEEPGKNPQFSAAAACNGRRWGVYQDNKNLLYRGCCHLRVNYNYARFNLAPDRKQVLCPERYANATPGSFRSARGTKLFSGAQTNFLLIRTAHRAPLDNKRPTNVAFCTQIMGYVGKFSTGSSQKASYRAFVSTREFCRSINELARPTDGFGMQSARPGSEVIDSSEARWVIWVMSVRCISALAWFSTGFVLFRWERAYYKLIKNKDLKADAVREVSLWRRVGASLFSRRIQHLKQTASTTITHFRSFSENAF